jgi:hypothetical protein
MPLSSTFSFPNPVNESAARLVAAGAALLAITAVTTNQVWLLVPLTYGFFARVATGPRFSPLGRISVALASRFTIPTFVPGPPKRFAQAIGAVLTFTTSVLAITIGFSSARWLLIPLILAASLEATVGYCVGCKIFAVLMNRGIISPSVCEACTFVTRPAQPVPH